MSKFIHNTLTDMPLLYFLALYGACSLIGLLVGSFWIWLCDGTRDEDLPDDVSFLKDPYRIALLSGNARRVTQLAVFDLLEQGYIQRLASRRRLLLVRIKYLQRSAQPPSLESLTPIQRAVWDWLQRPRRESEILCHESSLLKVVEPLCPALASPLRDHRLLETTLRSIMRPLVGWILGLGIVSVGLYKWIASIMAGHPETFCLLLMMVVGLAFTAIICRTQRLSDLGLRVLERLRVQFEESDLASRGSPQTGRHRMIAMALSGSAGTNAAPRPGRVRTTAECLPLPIASAEE